MEQSLLILLVEDEALIAIDLQTALEAAGFGVTHVPTGTNAIKALDDKPLKFSGIVTDIRLGSGLNGWAVARHARELVPQIPVVYMSGDSAHEHTAQGVPDSIMLEKPFASAQLITAISTLLDAAAGQSLMSGWRVKTQAVSA